MSILDDIFAKAKRDPQRVAFPEAENEKMMAAAYEAGRNGYVRPILVGSAERINALIRERGYAPEVFQVIDIH